MLENDRPMYRLYVVVNASVLVHVSVSTVRSRQT